MAVDQLPPGADTDRLLALQQKAHACAQQAQQLAARAAELGVTQYSGSVSTAPLSSTQGEEADSQQQHPDEAGRLPGEQEQQPADASREGQQPAMAVGQEQLSGQPDRLQQPAEAVQQAGAMSSLATLCCAVLARALGAKSVAGSSQRLRRQVQQGCRASPAGPGLEPATKPRSE